MNVLESLLIVAATLSALWWAFARHRAPVALERLSLAGLGLGVFTLALEGVHWQLVPWQLLALACAPLALLRRQRRGRPPPAAPAGGGAWRGGGTRGRRGGRRCPIPRRRGGCGPTGTPTPPGSTATSTRWTRTPPP